MNEILKKIGCCCIGKWVRKELIKQSINVLSVLLSGHTSSIDITCLWESDGSWVRSPHLTPIKNDSIAFILLHHSMRWWPAIFEMKHKRNRSKSFNNEALKMGLPDSAADEKANCVQTPALLYWSCRLKWDWHDLNMVAINTMIGNEMIFTLLGF